MVQKIIDLIHQNRLPLHNEKATQLAISVLFDNHKIPHQREFKFDAKNIVDFMLEDGLAIEVKIDGSARNIFKQCERYCNFDAVKSLILVSNRAMGIPATINQKPIFLVSLGRSWL